MTQRTIALCALVVMASGCYLGHGTMDPGEPRPVEPPPVEPPAGPTCGLTSGHVAVRYADVAPAPETGSCLRGDGEIYGVLTSVTPAPDTDGVVLGLDGCPGGLAPCPCSIAVDGVGADIAPQISQHGAIVAGTISESHVSLRVDFACDLCVGCPCPRPWIVLHAADAELPPPGVHREPWPASPPIPVTPGEQTCAMALDPTDPCAGTVYRAQLDARVDASGVPLISADEGETSGVVTDEFGSRYLALRNLRSDGMYPGCVDIDVPFVPAYVLWEEPVYAADDTDLTSP